MRGPARRHPTGPPRRRRGCPFWTLTQGNLDTSRGWNICAETSLPAGAAAQGNYAFSVEVAAVKRIERRGLAAGRAAHRGVLALRMIGTPMKFGERAEICGQGEPVDFAYEVVNGA